MCLNEVLHPYNGAMQTAGYFAAVKNREGAGRPLRRVAGRVRGATSCANTFGAFAALGPGSKLSSKQQNIAFPHVSLNQKKGYR